MSDFHHVKLDWPASHTPTSQNIWKRSWCQLPYLTGTDAGQLNPRVMSSSWLLLFSHLASITSCAEPRRPPPTTTSATAVAMSQPQHRFPYKDLGYTIMEILRILDLVVVLSATTCQGVILSTGWSPLSSPKPALFLFSACRYSQHTQKAE